MKAGMKRFQMLEQDRAVRTRMGTGNPVAARSRMVYNFGCKEYNHEVIP